MKLGKAFQCVLIVDTDRAHSVLMNRHLCILAGNYCQWIRSIVPLGGEKSPTQDDISGRFSDLSREHLPHHHDRSPLPFAREVHASERPKWFVEKDQGHGLVVTRDESPIARPLCLLVSIPCLSFGDESSWPVPRCQYPAVSLCESLVKPWGTSLCPGSTEASGCDSD